ncbi:hypothetical protein KIN20_014053 [Parelaphostrongylus tenuis]|uniref:DM14 domain-containing protein n=1 Tax=Parelaphostrongylus tenuis TaxID=148309 RepID=A0AAD5QN30_PARTN|nr:hypothetical protein KIN20_014053 [Parelaphostrongylus tenuis]
MDFSEFEKAVYGGNVEEDEELLAELLALQKEEEAKQRRSSPMPPSRPTASPATKVGISPALGVDPAMLAAALADNVEVDEHALENDEDLLAELSGLIGSKETGSTAEPAGPGHVSKLPDSAMVSRLSGLLSVYEKLLSASNREGNTLKIRRHERTVDRLKGLLSKAQRGEDIDESEIPPEPPSVTSIPRDEQMETTAPQPPPIPKRSTSASSPLSTMLPRLFLSVHHRQQRLRKNVLIQKN